MWIDDFIPSVTADDLVWAKDQIFMFRKLYRKHGRPESLENVKLLEGILDVMKEQFATGDGITLKKFVPDPAPMNISEQRYLENRQLKVNGDVNNGTGFGIQL